MTGQATPQSQPISRRRQLIPPIQPTQLVWQRRADGAPLGRRIG